MVVMHLGANAFALLTGGVCHVFDRRFEADGILITSNQISDEMTTLFVCQQL
jgi:hypothetical protein